MTTEELIQKLEDSYCYDPWPCIFGMHIQHGGHYGCRARYPHGDMNEPDQGCIAHQAAKLLRRLNESQDISGNL